MIPRRRRRSSQSASEVASLGCWLPPKCHRGAHAATSAAQHRRSSVERARGVARTAEVAHFDPAVALRADWEGLEVALVLRFRWKVLVRVSRDRGRKIEPMRSNRARQPCPSRLAVAHRDQTDSPCASAPPDRPNTASCCTAGSPIVVIRPWCCGQGARRRGARGCPGCFVGGRPSIPMRMACPR